MSTLDICQIRLDFNSLTTAGPPSQGTNVGACPTGGDIVAITSPSGANPPEICGQLTGQHGKYM